MLDMIPSSSTVLAYGARIVRMPYCPRYRFSISAKLLSVLCLDRCGLEITSVLFELVVSIESLKVLGFDRSLAFAPIIGTAGRAGVGFLSSMSAMHFSAGLGKF